MSVKCVLRLYEASQEPGRKVKVKKHNEFTTITYDPDWINKTSLLAEQWVISKKAPKIGGRRGQENRKISIRCALIYKLFCF